MKFSELFKNRATVRSQVDKTNLYTEAEYMDFDKQYAYIGEAKFYERKDRKTGESTYLTAPGVFKFSDGKIISYGIKDGLYKVNCKVEDISLTKIKVPLSQLPIDVQKELKKSKEVIVKQDFDIVLEID